MFAPLDFFSLAGVTSVPYEALGAGHGEDSAGGNLLPEEGFEDEAPDLPRPLPPAFDKAAGHELETIQLTWELNSIVLPGGGFIPLVSPSGSTAGHRSDDEGSTATLASALRGWRSGAAGSSMDSPQRASEPPHRECHSYVSYPSSDGPMRPPVGSWLNRSGQPISQRVVESEVPRRTQKWARHKKSHTEPGTAASSPILSPRERESQIRDFQRSVSGWNRNFAKLEGFQKPQTSPNVTSHVSDMQPPTVFHNFGYSETPVSTTTAAATDGVATANLSVGYASVPVPAAADWRFGAGKWPCGAQHSDLKNHIFEPIYAQVRSEKISGGVRFNTGECELHDRFGDFPAETWEIAFGVPADKIISVVPTFFLDECELCKDAWPRFDLVANLVDDAWIRYHLRAPLYASWHSLPEAVRKRRAALAKFPENARPC